MNRTNRNALIIIICILLAASAGLILHFSLRRIPMNPPGTVGNTAGNLNNGGTFCEHDGVVYFANAADGGSLFRMAPDETDVRRILSLKVRNILAGGRYLFFFQTGASNDSGLGQFQGAKSFDRCTLDGSGITSLTRDTVVTGQLVDNYLYLLTAPRSGPVFCKIKIDRSEQVDLADYSINPACVQNGHIYYNGTQNDHYLYALNTASDTVSEIWRGNLWYPVVEGDYVYYLDVAENYRLCRYSLSQNVVQVLTNDRVDCFNVGSGYIYYQKNSRSPQLRCMRTDGTENQVVAEGTYTEINMTSRYVYFRAFGDETAMYHSPLGSSSYSEFRPQ